MSGPHDPSPSLPGLQKPKRFRTAFHYELISCGLRGHELVGLDAARIRPEDALVVRELDGFRWYRCLRCDSWLPLPKPATAVVEFPPSKDEIRLPLRGSPLRDKFVLRLIAIDRGLHFLVLGFLSAAVFDYAANRVKLRPVYERILAAFQGDLSGPTGVTHHGLLASLEKLFSYSSSRLYLTASVLALYAAVECAEMVGLWMLQRWAEYLTLVVTASLLPLEIYEMAQRVSVVKVAAFVINVAVVAYLLYAKRLFGIRGGSRVLREERDADVGWEALERNSPPALPQGSPTRTGAA